MKLCDFKSCTGCGACLNVCPAECIRMECNNQGFEYPKIQEENCIHCGACTKVCPQIKNENTDQGGKNAKVFLGGGILSNNEIERSSSGGMGYALAKHVLNEGGIAFGAAYDECMRVVHIGVEKEEKLYLLQGSKYVQSSMGRAMKEVHDALNKGRKVIFFGVGCQVEGLLAFLEKKKYPNLITCDLLCAGASSPGAFERYLQMLEEKYNCSITDYNFRDKHYGYGYMLCSFETERGKRKMLSGSDAGFVRSMGCGFVREACFGCKYASIQRVGDISLGDFWGEKSKDHQNRGTSLIFANTEKGKELLKSLQESKIWMEERNVANAVRGQATALSGGKQKPDNYDAFFADVFSKE